MKIYTDKTLACLQVEIKWSHCLVKQIETPLKHTNKTEDQIRTILDDMLGPSHCTSTPKKWQPNILVSLLYIFTYLP